MNQAQRDLLFTGRDPVVATRNELCRLKGTLQMLLDSYGEVTHPCHEGLVCAIYVVDQHLAYLEPEPELTDADVTVLKAVLEEKFCQGSKQRG